MYQVFWKSRCLLLKSLTHFVAEIYVPLYIPATNTARDLRLKKQQKLRTQPYTKQKCSIADENKNPSSGEQGNWLPCGWKPGQPEHSYPLSSHVLRSSQNFSANRIWERLDINWEIPEGAWMHHNAVGKHGIKPLPKICEPGQITGMERVCYIFWAMLLSSLNSFNSKVPIF